MNKIIKLLTFIFFYNLTPKRLFLKIQFKRKQGYRLNLSNPVTLNEKIQWLKLNDKKEINKICADKFTVRDFVGRVVSQDILIPILQHFDDYKKIEEVDLPEIPFVVKTSNGCGQVVIVRQPESVNLKMLKQCIKKWLHPINRIYPYGKEWQYKGTKPKILFEKLLLNNGVIPDDYKLHCINGKVEFIYVSIDREGINKRNIYTRDWEPLNFSWTNEKSKKERAPELKKPDNLNKMIEISEKIGQYFKYVRVDLYSISDNVYLGEITLHHASGFDKIEPIDWDIYFGQRLNLNIEPNLKWS